MHGLNAATAKAPHIGLDRYREALVREIAESRISLPLLPRVAGDLLTMLQETEADMADLSVLIHRDQALAGHVLRVANSAAYGTGESIVSLQQAITRLGTKLLSEIALAVSLKSDVFRAPGFEREIALIWSHALASGVWGKEVSRMKRCNVEGQFLCGLLHTIGKPILLQSLCELKKEVGLPLDNAEAVVLVDELHGALGKRLAAEWNLPRQLQVCCEHYAHYEQAPSFENETAMTYLADRLGHWTVSPALLAAAALLEDPVFDHLNFYPEERETLLGRSEEVSQAVRAMEL